MGKQSAGAAAGPVAAGRCDNAEAEREAGFKAGKKWAEIPAEYPELCRIVERIGEKIEGRYGPGAAAEAIAAACFDQAPGSADTAQFWARAARVEGPGEEFVYGFYYGLKDVFDELNSAQGRF